MTVIELCKHNLTSPEVQEALQTLNLLIGGRAEVREEQCIGNCKACSADVLIARINKKIFTGSDNAEVIYLIEKYLKANCSCCNDE